MRKYILSFILLFSSFCINAQYHWENEPNDWNGDAELLPPGSPTVYATLGYGDNFDYFRTNYAGVLSSNVAGSYEFEMQAYNYSENTAFITIQVFNVSMNNLYYEQTIEIDSYDSRSAHFTMCGTVLEDLLIVFSTEGEETSIDYEFQMNLKHAYNDIEPNGSGHPPTVLNGPLFENKSFAIGYSPMDIYEIDEEDLFYINITEEFDTDTLIIKGTNISCSNFSWLRYVVYKNGTEIIDHGYVGNVTNVGSDQEVSSAISLTEANLSVGDYILIVMSSQNAFGYDFIGKADSDGGEYVDPEDNCCAFNAVNLPENFTRSGNIGSYSILQPSGNIQMVDEYDTYKFTVNETGTIAFEIEALVVECIVEPVKLKYDILDEQGYEIFSESKEIIRWEANQCGILIKDTVLLGGIYSGTYYLRLRAEIGDYIIWFSANQSDEIPGNTNNNLYQLIHYSLKYNNSDPAQYFDAEPNNYESEAIELNEGMIATGNINFIKSGEEDYYDYYKITSEGDKNITLHAKITYRGETVPYADNMVPNINVQSLGYSRKIPITTNDNLLKYGDTYNETIQICGVPGGEFVFMLYNYSDVPFEYEIWYEVNETIQWNNDDSSGTTMNNTTFIINEGEDYQGKLGYWQGSLDNSDYYKLITEKSGNVRVYIEATNVSCEKAVPYVAVQLRNQPGTINFSAVYITDTDNGVYEILPGETVYKTIDFCGVNPETLFLNISMPIFGYNPNPVRYTFRYELIDTVALEYTDAEPNNTIAEATEIVDGQTVKGNVGYGQDKDYYKFYATGDVITIPVHIINNSCKNTYATVYAFNESGQQIASGAIGNASLTPGNSANNVLQFSISTPGWVTLEVRPFSNLAGVLYTFTLNPQPPNSNFTVAGDLTSCLGEQNFNAIGVIDNGELEYHWELPQGGGTIVGTDSSAVVTWTETGNRRVALYLTNAAGTSETRFIDVIVNNDRPTQIPVVYQSGRKLITSSLPQGATYQWFRNDIAIAGATDSVYYADLSGTFTVKFANDCGPGPESNEVVFGENGLTQSITFPALGSVQLTPNAKVKLPATTSSGLPIQFIKVSGPGYIQNDTLYLSGTGTLVGDVVIRAVQYGNNNYLPAEEVVQTLNVLKGNQVITFDSIPNLLYSSTPYALTASANTGLNVLFTIVSGNSFGKISSNNFTTTGVGTVTIRAYQNGSANYNAAPVVERTFCIGLRTLTSIKGEAEPCQGVFMYTTDRIPGANFVWELSGGGTLTSSNDTAWVQWTESAGEYQLSVKANSVCDEEFSNTFVKIINISQELPGIVNTMLPANGIQTAGLPLQLSWVPVSRASSYDIYIWDSTATEPTVAYASNITGVNFTIPQNALAYNNAYKWRVVAKSPCGSTPGIVQSFRLIPLPDVEVVSVNHPAASSSGQTISVSWEVKNNGPGNTITSQNWTDAVLLSYFPDPNFNSITSNANSWHYSELNKSLLLIGTKTNPVALLSGESYTNSIDFKIPLSYQHPVYVHVITDYGKKANTRMLQTVFSNDTLSAPGTMNITLTPTPDLRVEAVNIPSVAFSGSTLSITYQVKNYGALTPAGSNWIDSVFISRNPLFKREDCMPLYVPGTMGRYSNIPVAARNLVSDTLDQNDTYTRTIEALVPNFTMGNWYVYVKTNANNKLYEGIFDSNNEGNRAFEILLSPTPKLQVQNMMLASTEVSSTQPVGINWEIINNGFNDLKEKNRGYYVTVNGFCSLPCMGVSSTSTGGGTGTVTHCVVNGYNISDSIGFGSSFWHDKVFLSTNPNLANPNDGILVGTRTHGGEIIYESDLPIGRLPVCGFISNDINTSAALNPGAIFPVSSAITIPKDLPAGNYYVYILTNAENTVFEYPAMPSFARSAMPLTVVQPDLVVNEINTNASASAGEEILINYTISNTGQGTVFGSQRTDRLFVSDFPHFDGSAQLVSSSVHAETVPAGTSVSHSMQYRISESTTGTKYFFVVTNQNQAFGESNMANNTSASVAVAVSARVAADLSVASIVTGDTLTALRNSYIVYTVNNDGPGNILGSITDELYIDCSNIFTVGTAVKIGQRKKSRNVPSGSSYTDTIFFAIPAMMTDVIHCFSGGYFTDAFLYVKTNSDSLVFESNNHGNNLSSSAEVVVLSPYADHYVADIWGISDTVTVARQMSVSWKVKNYAYTPPLSYYNNNNYEAVYFSTDTELNESDLKVYELRQLIAIGVNDSAVLSRTFNLKDIPAGEYYVIVKTNDREALSSELETGNNTALLKDALGNPKKVVVIRPDLPDLRDEIVSAPDVAATGQPVQIIHRVSNEGAGVTFPGTWKNGVWLSSEMEVNKSSRLLSSVIKNIPLQPGTNYLDTIQATIPVNIPEGNYYLIVKANSESHVVETDHDNNSSIMLITIYHPEPVDLTVDQVYAPDTLWLGNVVDSIKWNLHNISPNPVVGQFTEGVYLSTSEVFDSTAILITTVLNKDGLQPLMSKELSTKPILDNVTEGAYYLFVRSDVQNNIIENDKLNNVSATGLPVYVKVNELLLGTSENFSLHRDRKFYKLVVPDTLEGSTIRIHLNSNDSLSMVNEMYVGRGYVPDPSKYDFKFNKPNYGNQEILMAGALPGVYYIDVRNRSVNPLNQNATLTAEVLPFTILNVQSSSGGNIGNVTVKISGALFEPGMVAKLTRAGTTIQAHTIYYLNTTELFATFNLKDVPLGVYNVQLEKPDDITVLSNGFTVEPANNGGLITGGGSNTSGGNGDEPGCDPGAPAGKNSQLVVELTAPNSAFPGTNIALQITFYNPTNYDIPAQTRSLYSVEGVPLSLSKDDLKNAESVLNLILTEPGGPPGMIRAGGGGTITIYAITPFSLAVNPVPFNLK